MSPPLTIEQLLTQHELHDERRFGGIEKRMEVGFAEMNGKMDKVLMAVSAAQHTADEAAEAAEVTGSPSLCLTSAE